MSAPALRQAFAATEVGLETVLERRPGPPWKVAVSGDTAVVFHPYGEAVRLPAPLVEALRFVEESCAPFRPAEMCDRIDDQARLDVARTLARHGLVRVRSD